MKNILIITLFLLPQVGWSQISQVSTGGVIQAQKVNEVIDKSNIHDNKLSELNTAINKIYDIGDVRTSLLTETIFQARNGNCWVMMNGQLVTGSLYASLTGRNSLPNAQGRFLRTAGGSAAALAEHQEDDFKSHTHTTGKIGWGAGPLDSGSGRTDPNSPLNTWINGTGATGGTETRPKNITVNYFVKINNCN